MTMRLVFSTVLPFIITTFMLHYVHAVPIPFSIPVPIPMSISLPFTPHSFTTTTSTSNAHIMSASQSPSPSLSLSPSLSTSPSPSPSPSPSHTLASSLSPTPAITAQSECRLIPDPGPCHGFFRRYYFDWGSRSCESFIYSGCDGTVPFRTSQLCEEARCDLLLPSETPTPIATSTSTTNDRLTSSSSSSSSSSIYQTISSHSHNNMNKARSFGYYYLHWWQLPTFATQKFNPVHVSSLSSSSTILPSTFNFSSSISSVKQRKDEWRSSQMNLHRPVDYIKLLNHYPR